MSKAKKENKHTQQPLKKEPVVQSSVQKKQLCSNLNASQHRAKYALQAIKKVTKELESEQQKEFKSYLQALPAMVQMNGLGQAIAFYRSHFTATDKSNKGAVAYATLYAILNSWLCASTTEEAPFSIYPEGDLLENIVNGDMQQYRLTHSELQSLLSWLKKMAIALIETENNE